MTDRSAFSPWDEARARAVIGVLQDLPGACLPVLHALQAEFGYIHAEAIPLVAEALVLSRAEVVGVVEFYSDFRREPPAGSVIKICLADACRSMGSEALVAHIEHLAGARMGETAAGAAIAIEPVYCLGNCALSPAISVGGRLHGRVTPEKASRLVAGQP